MSEKKTILVVDDEVKITEVVSSYLENSGFQPICAFNAVDALAMVQQKNPDLIILDLMLPDMTGEAICLKIRETSRVPIIMLTAKASEEAIITGLGIGADDYVTKPFSPKQLIARVEAVLRRLGTHPAEPQASDSEDELEIDLVNREVRKNKQPIILTPNELNILTALAKHPSKIFTREELIATALGSDFDGFDRVIDTHIKNIRQKLGDDGRSPHYILTVHGTGYKFGGAKP